MIDFHTHWISSGLPDLAARSGNSRWPVPPLLCDWAHPKPGTERATTINDSLAEAVRPFYTDSVVYRPPNLRYLVDTLGAGHACFGTASALLSLQ
jgi:hypothetical protein